MPGSWLGVMSLLAQEDIDLTFSLFPLPLFPPTLMLLQPEDSVEPERPYTLDRCNTGETSYFGMLKAKKKPFCLLHSVFAWYIMMSLESVI